MLTFMRNFIGVKTDHAVQAGVEALVRWDPQAATEAELRSMEQHLDELGLQVAQARAAYDRERKEAETIKALLQQRMAAAEQLEKQRNIEPTAERKAALEKSLATLLDMLEQMTPDVEREAQDETEAQDVLSHPGEDLCRRGCQAQGSPQSARARPARYGTRRTAARDGRAAGRGGPAGGRAQPPPRVA